MTEHDPTMPASDDIPPSSQLLANCESAARRARSQIRWRGVLTWLTAVSMLAVALMLIDATLRREELGLRWLSWGILLTAAGWLMRWRLLPALRCGIRPLDIANWLEQRYPDQAGRLPVAFELAQLDAAEHALAPSECIKTDHRFGSHSLRQAALSDWTARPLTLDWNQMISTSSWRRAALGLTILLGLGAVVYFVRPVDCQRALARLLIPWAARPWPRLDQLQLIDLPTAVGRGDVLDLQVIDLHPPLPQSVFIEVRHLDSNTAPPLRLPATSDGQLASATLPPVHHDIQIRAVGGEDQAMPWHTVRVAQLPTWNDYRFEVFPPDYLRGSPALRTLSSSISSSEHHPSYSVIANSLKVVAGSQVRFFGTVSQPLTAVALQQLRPVQSTDSTAPTQPLVAHLADDQISVTLGNSQHQAQAIPHSCSWTFMFTTLSGDVLNSRGRWTIEVIPDAAPSVTLDSFPLSSLALGASLELIGHANDDWGLAQVIAQLSLESKPETIVEIPFALSDPGDSGLQAELDLVSLFASVGHTLQMNDCVTVRLEARDQLGQVGSSHAERVTIASPERQLELIAQRQAAIANQLGELVTAQRSAQHIAKQMIDATQGAVPPEPSTTALANIAQLQLSIQQRFSKSSTSVAQNVAQALELLKRNRLEHSETYSNLQQIQQQMAEHGAETIEQALAVAASMQSNWSSASHPQQSENWRIAADELETAQSQSLQLLQSLADQSQQLQDLQQLRQQLTQLTGQQQSIADATRQIQLDALRHRLTDAAQPLAALREQQLQVASQLEDWLSQAQHSQMLGSESTALHEQLAEAAGTLADDQTVSAMRSAGSRLLEQQISQAVELQQRIAQSLQTAASRADGHQPARGSQQTTEKRWSDFVQGLMDIIQRQQTLADAYNALPVTPQGTQNLDQLQSLLAPLLEQQQLVRNELQQLRSVAQSMPTLDWTLQQSDSDLARAQAAARRLRISPEATDAADEALRKLKLLAQALSSAPAAGPSESSSDDSSDSSESSNVHAPAIVNLKLIRGLQVELRNRTIELDKIEDADLRQQHQDDISRQQRQLAAQFEEILDSLTPDKTSGIGAAQ
ncbi:MAG: hypothetical protein KF752_19040 [Pirellulaceae bacterium]|nr:hypothetical protein [Pirellulaceae bacterium]